MRTLVITLAALLAVTAHADDDLERVDANADPILASAPRELRLQYLPNQALCIDLQTANAAEIDTDWNAVSNVLSAFMYGWHAGVTIGEVFRGVDPSARVQGDRIRFEATVKALCDIDSDASLLQTMHRAENALRGGS